jgi:hypothetical protein
MISFYSFWEKFSKNHHIFENLFDNFDISENINDEEVKLIIAGNFIYENEKHFLLNSNKKKVLFISEPVQHMFPHTHELLKSNSFDLVFGCVSENLNKNYFKYPLYLFDYDFSEKFIKDKNNFVKNSNLDSKHFCVIMQNNNNISPMYNELVQIKNIWIPNNEEKQDNPFILKDFLFCICSEKATTDYGGYITCNLRNTISFGTIPIFSGDFDSIDSKIFNSKRILFYKNNDINSIIDVKNKIKYLLENPLELQKFYEQPLFAPTAYQTIQLLNLKFQFAFYQLFYSNKINLNIKFDEEIFIQPSANTKNIKNNFNLFLKHNEILSNSPFSEIEVKNKKFDIENIENDYKSYLYLEHMKNNCISFHLSYKTISDLSLLENFILIIDFGNLGGGTQFFIDSIISKYKYKQTFVILRPNKDLIDIFVNDDYILKGIQRPVALTMLKKVKKQIIKVFVNNLLNHNMKFVKDVLNLTSTEKILITHDYFLVSFNYQPLSNQLVGDKNDINLFDTIITQNKMNLSTFGNFINENKKIILTELPDFANKLEKVETENKKIKIGIIGSISPIKGENVFLEIINYIKNKDLPFEIVVFGYLNNYNNFFPYKDIFELNTLLINEKPNLILECSLWMETYSYTLTLSMITDLPILCLKKPFPSVIMNRLEKYEKANYFSTFEEFEEIVPKIKQNYFYTIEPRIYFNSFWDNFFITKMKKNSNPYEGKFQHDIQPYAIYFPQFHEIKENNKSFYNGFTDVKNLKLLEKSSNIVRDFETPSLKDFNLQSYEDYDLVKTNIMQKQIDLLNHYNLKGFALYYFWFSKNTITNKKQIFEDVIDQFFSNKLDMKGRKIFFVWANESWTKNPAFNVTNSKIEFEFTEENVKKYIIDIMLYFKHDNYLKINNKPVFSVLHPWFFTKNEMNTLFEMLESECIANGFDGIHAIQNQMYKDNYESSFINNYHHFNYKTCTSISRIKDNVILNYEKYIKQDIQEDCQGIHTLVYDFDNRARMIKPDRLHNSTICINNTEIEKIKMTKCLIKKYETERSDLEKIMILNAWNEWGEKMAFEPSNEFGFYNLNLFFNLVKSE